MKKEFTSPEIELIRLEAMDVIATSDDLDINTGENELPFVPSL